jgi:hypothetical protein
VAFVFGRGGRLGDLVRTIRGLPAHYRRGRDPQGAAKAVTGRVVDDEEPRG